MTLTLNLSPELEDRLREAAETRGISAAEYTVQLLEQSVQRQSRNEGLIALMNEWMQRDEEDDGDISWEEMLQQFDKDRGYRKLFPPELKGMTW